MPLLRVAINILLVVGVITVPPLCYRKRPACGSMISNNADHSIVYYHKRDAYGSGAAVITQPQAK